MKLAIAAKEREREELIYHHEEAQLLHDRERQE